MIRLVCGAVAVATLAGCAAQSADLRRNSAEGPASRTSVTSTAPIRLVCGAARRGTVAGCPDDRADAAAICRAAFPHGGVLGWDAADVAGVRAYQYGGPAPHRPLEWASPAAPASPVGAWCLIRHGRRSASLYAVVPGRQPQRAITITGPGVHCERAQLGCSPQRSR